METQTSYTTITVSDIFSHAMPHLRWHQWLTLPNSGQEEGSWILGINISLYPQEICQVEMTNARHRMPKWAITLWNTKTAGLLPYELTRLSNHEVYCQTNALIGWDRCTSTEACPPLRSSRVGLWRYLWTCSICPVTAVHGTILIAFGFSTSRRLGNSYELIFFEIEFIMLLIYRGVTGIFC